MRVLRPSGDHTPIRTLASTHDDTSTSTHAKHKPCKGVEGRRAWNPVCAAVFPTSPPHRYATTRSQAQSKGREGGSLSAIALRSQVKAPLGFLVSSPESRFEGNHMPTNPPRFPPFHYMSCHVLHTCTLRGQNPLLLVEI